MASSRPDPDKMLRKLVLNCELPLFRTPHSIAFYDAAKLRAVQASACILSANGLQLEWDEEAISNLHPTER
jgi:hypothetical protein